MKHRNLLALLTITLLSMTATAQRKPSIYDTADARATKTLLVNLKRIERPLSTELGLTLFALSGSRTHIRRGNISDEIKDVVKQLRARQWENGSFYDAAPKGPRVRPVVQAIATLGLSSYAPFGSDEDKDAAARAVEQVLANVREDGTCAPGYDNKEPADFDATVWSAIALGAARYYEIEVPKEKLATMCAWLRAQTDQLKIDDKLVARQLSGRGRVAATLFAHYICGIDPKAHEELDSLHGKLAKKAPKTNDAAAFFFGNAALYQRGGPDWKAMQPSIKKAAESANKGKQLGKAVAVRALRTAGLQVYWRFGNLLRRR